MCSFTSKGYCASVAAGFLDAFLSFFSFFTGAAAGAGAGLTSDMVSIVECGGCDKEGTDPF